MATTTNFGWETPDDTDLVKDGAAAIRTALGGVDTSFVDLKGGTTGQVLAKASGTDLDFSWVAQDDSNAIQNAIVDAKGDLVAASAADTPARLAVGTNGQYLSANSSTATGLEWVTLNAGGMTLLSTTTLSGASTTVSSIPATYKDIYVIIKNYVTSVDESQLLMNFNGDTNSNRHADRRNYNYGTGSAGSFTSTSFWLADGTDNATSASLLAFTIPDYANTTSWKMAYGYSITQFGGNTANFKNTQIMGLYNQTSEISSLRFLAASGDLSSGTVLVYGVK